MASDDPTNPRFVNLLGLAGHRLRDFELGEIIGQGGFGVVYEARRAGVTYALKLPLLDHSDEKRRAQAIAELPRIKKEAAALQSLQHPNIVELAEYFSWNPLKDSIGDADGLPVLVMRYVDGVSMDRWVRRAPGPTLRQILVAYRQVLSALEYCHAHSFFHRDLKPSNILVDSAGRPTLIDFGIAKSKALKTSTEVATWIGTTDFFSPEYLQYPFTRDAMKGLPFTFAPAQDLYALGHTIFLTLTGATAWSAWKSVLSTQPSVAFMAIAQRVDLPLPSTLNPRVPTVVDAFVGKLMARELAIRFATAASALSVLDEVLKQRLPELDKPFALPTAEECERRVEEYSVAYAESLDEESEESDDELASIDVSLSSLMPGNSQTHLRPQAAIESPAKPKSPSKETRVLRTRPPSGRGAPPTSLPASPPASHQAAKALGEGAPVASEAASPVVATAGFNVPSAVSVQPEFADVVVSRAAPAPVTPRDPTGLSPELERLRDEFRDYERPAASSRRGVLLATIAAVAVVVLLAGLGMSRSRASVPERTDAESLLTSPAVFDDAGVAAEAVYQPQPVEKSTLPPAELAPSPASAAPLAQGGRPIRASSDSRAVEEILRREYGGQRPVVAPDGTTAGATQPVTPPSPAGWGTRGVYAQPAAAPAGPRRFGVGIGSELAGTLLKPLDSRIGAMPVVCKLKRAWAPRGEVLLPTGTMFFGQSSTSSGRFTVALTRMRLPDGVEAPLQALAYDVGDKKPGLSPTRRIQQQQSGAAPGVGETVARGAANIALGQVQGGPVADVARGAGQSIINQQGSGSTVAQEALLLDAPIDVTIFITEAF